MCRNTAPTGSDGNEYRDDKEAKTACQTVENEVAEPIELCKLVGDAGIESLETTMNKVMSMPSSWWYSGISPIYNGKGPVLDCGNFRGMKIKYHTMKLWERIIENSLRIG